MSIFTAKDNNSQKESSQMHRALGSKYTIIDQHHHGKTLKMAKLEEQIKGQTGRGSHATPCEQNTFLKRISSDNDNNVTLNSTLTHK